LFRLGPWQIDKYLSFFRKSETEASKSICRE
jgi:hypothetical protein